MSKFYIGQRVRIKYSNDYPMLAGQEGTIVKKVDEFYQQQGFEWYVAPDVWGSHRAPDGFEFGPNSSQLEPLSPPKQELSSWEAFEELFGWKPEQVKEAA